MAAHSASAVGRRVPSRSATYTYSEAVLCPISFYSLFRSRTGQEDIDSTRAERGEEKNRHLLIYTISNILSQQSEHSSLVKPARRARSLRKREKSAAERLPLLSSPLSLFSQVPKCIAHRGRGNKYSNRKIEAEAAQKEVRGRGKIVLISQVIKLTLTSLSIGRRCGASSSGLLANDSSYARTLAPSLSGSD